MLPSLSTLTPPLRELIRQDCLWQESSTSRSIWQSQERHQRRNKTRVLRSNKINHPSSWCVQNSPKGYPATRPETIAVSSKTLTDKESRYANIERELLDVVYGCERFHTYLFGQCFVGESHHKPLESMQVSLNLVSAPPCTATKNATPMRLCPYQI